MCYYVWAYKVYATTQGSRQMETINNAVTAAKKTLKAIKAPKVTQEEKVVAAKVVVAEQAAKPTKYGIGKLPRNGLHEGTKHGNGGTAGTYAAIVKAIQAAGGELDLASIQRVCTENNDKGFARYAVRNHWLLPVQPKV